MPEGRGEWSSRLPGTVLQRVAACCSVLLCVAECCSVLQCVAVCCSLRDYSTMPKGQGEWLVFLPGTVLQCVAVCCSVLQWRRLFRHARKANWMASSFDRYCVTVLPTHKLVAYTQAYCAKITTRTACSPGEKGENYTYAGSLILKRCSQSNHCVSCAVKTRRRLCFEENRKEIHNSWQESRNFLKICIFWCFCYHNQKLHTFIKKRIAQLSTRFS